MKEIIIIIKKEIKTRIVKKSFWLFALLSPLIYIIPFTVNALLHKSDESKDLNEVNYVVENESDNEKLILADNNILFKKLNLNRSEIDSKLDSLNNLLVIDFIDFKKEKSITPFKFYVNKNHTNINQIEKYLNKIFLEKVKNINYNYKEIFVIQKDNNSDITKMIAFGMIMLLYVLYIMFNNDISRSIIEESNNKLIELLSLHINLKNLLYGKVLGVTSLSFIRLIVWIGSLVVMLCILSYAENILYNTNDINNYIEQLKNINIGNNSLSTIMIISIFFVFGFLLNGLISTTLSIITLKKDIPFASFLSNILNFTTIYVVMYILNTNDPTNFSDFIICNPLFSYLLTPSLILLGLSNIQILKSIIILIFFVLILFKISAKVFISLSIESRGK